jgi:hypothetical protein
MVTHDGHATSHQPKPSSKLLFVYLTVTDMKTKTMIDTGSTISAIASNYLKKIHHGRIHRVVISCKSANNTDLKILGKVKLTVMVHNITTIVNAFIIEDLCTDILLGNDWCNDYHVDISYHFKNITVWMGRQWAQVSLSELTNADTIIHLRTSDDIVIPPWSAKVIRTSTEVAKMSAAIFTPSTTLLEKQDILAPHALLQIDHFHTILSLLNSSNTSKTIFKGTRLGETIAQEDERCCYVNNNSDDRAHHSSQNTTTPFSIRGKLNSLLSHLSKNKKQSLHSVLLQHLSVFDTSIL